MYDRILFPTDGSEDADAALEHVLALAAAHDATLHVLHVADTEHDSVTRIGGSVIDVLEREGEAIVAEAADRATEQGVETVTEVVQGGVPVSIVDYAAARDIDLVVMATRGREGIEQRLLGSTTDRVLRQSTVPVLTLGPERGQARYPYRDVLVPTDGSAGAAAALEHAIDLAVADGATLHALSVVDTGLGGGVRPEEYLDDLEPHAETAAGEAAATAAERGVETTVEEVAVGAAVDEEIRSYVQDTDIDLVVLSTTGRTGLDRYLLGSVAEAVVRTVSVPVLVVPVDEPE